jgi:hypothetical protein
MKEQNKEQGSSEQKLKTQRNAHLNEQKRNLSGFPALPPEQQPHGGGVNSPEPHPPKEKVLDPHRWPIFMVVRIMDGDR